MHQHGLAGDRAVGEDRPVSGDPGIPRQAPTLVADAVGEFDGHAGQARPSTARRCRTPGRTGRRTPTPAGRPGPRSTPSPTASIVPAPSLCGMTRGNGIAEPSQPPRFLVSPGLTAERVRRTRTSPGTGLRRRQLTDLEHLGRRPLPFVPRCPHRNSPRRPASSPATAIVGAVQRGAGRRAARATPPPARITAPTAATAMPAASPLSSTLASAVGGTTSAVSTAGTSSGQLRAAR